VNGLGTTWMDMLVKSKIQHRKSKENPKVEIQKVRRSGFRFYLDFGCWILAFSLAIPLGAQPTTAPKTAEGAFDVIEWVVFVCDPNQPQANSNTLYHSTLPDFVGSRRSPAPVEKQNDPAPIGVIRFQGATGKEKVDVLLQNKGGRFLATWPKAVTRSTGVLWQNLVLTDQAPGSLEQVGASNWMNDLRKGTTPFLLKDGRGDRFILYDAEPKYALPLKVQAGAGEGQYFIANSDKVSVRDLTLYKNETDGWHVANLPELKPTAATQPATRPTTTLATTRPATAPAATQALAIASTRPTTQASSQPTTKPTGQPVALAATGLKQATEVLAPWKERLTSAGLPEMDWEVIRRILEKHALDTRRLTAIYRLPDEQLDLLLPLEVTPQPRHTIRVGLVIVRSIDPAIVNEIETLVAQLGDPKWDTREAAQKRLLEIGLAAKPKLDALGKSAKDPEVVYRIERVIATLTREPTPTPDNAQVDR
jgi:hypothetical protein